jgi:hypothetical protein
MVFPQKITTAALAQLCKAENLSRRAQKLAIGPGALDATQQHLPTLGVAHAPPLGNFGDAALATNANIGVIQGADINAR